MNIRILSTSDVKKALPMTAAIAGMKDAFAQLSAGKADVPLRASVRVPEQEGIALFMPAFMQESKDLAIKIVSVFPKNVERGNPMINASVLVLDESNGRPLALIEGSSLTAIRTAAGAGAATDLLARPDARVLAMLGSGVQARTGVEAVCTVRDIDEVRIFSPNRTHAEAFADEVAGQEPIPQNVTVVENSAQAVRGADVVYTATTSHTPTFNGDDLKPGAHVNGVGSFTLDMQEVDVTTVQRSLIVIDDTESMRAEAGDIMIPLNSGQIPKGHVYAELGEVVLGLKSGRTDADQITFFKSVGVAVQDAVAARIALQTAEKLGLGTLVEF